jgi:hypothetical protein
MVRTACQEKHHAARSSRLGHSARFSPRHHPKLGHTLTGFGTQEWRIAILFRVNSVAYSPLYPSNPESLQSELVVHPFSLPDFPELPCSFPFPTVSHVPHHRLSSFPAVSDVPLALYTSPPPPAAPSATLRLWAIVWFSLKRPTSGLRDRLLHHLKPIYERVQASPPTYTPYIATFSFLRPLLRFSLPLHTQTRYPISYGYTHHTGAPSSHGA